MPAARRTRTPPAGTRLVAFLRAINVGGHTVKMEDLRRHFVRLGLADVETFIASGNVVFTARERDIPALERRLEQHLHRAFGFEVHTFVRTAEEVAAIAAARPFPAARMREARVVCVGFLKEPLPPAGTRALMALRSPNDDFKADGAEVWWLCRTGQGESAFSNAVFEKATKARATFRGMNTVVKLAAKYGFGAEP